MAVHASWVMEHQHDRLERGGGCSIITRRRAVTMLRFLRFVGTTDIVDREPGESETAAALKSKAANVVKDKVAPTARRLATEETGTLEIPLKKAAQGVAEATKAEEPNAPTFYSKAERVANEKIGGSASGDAILATLRDNGVKESEIQWMGLDDYLRGKAKVSKSDLRQYITEHKIELRDVDYGTPEQRQMQQLSKQREKLYAENNRIWADHLRYADGSTDLFNAMKQGSDLGIHQTIAQMPEDLQQHAQRFVDTDRSLVDLDNQISKLQYQLDKSGAKAPKYESYTLPGEKTNYTEKLLTLPDKTKAKIDELNARLSEMANRPAAEHAAHPEWKQEWDAIHKQRNALLAQPEFRGPHFDEPNIVAHIRHSDRLDVDGRKNLFLEEIQSDWGQRGKQVGFLGKPQQELEKQIADLRKKESEARRYWTEHPDDQAGTTPHSASLRRFAGRHAALQPLEQRCAGYAVQKRLA